jgi:hypothetical protein
MDWIEPMADSGMVNIPNEGFGVYKQNLDSQPPDQQKQQRESRATLDVQQLKRKQQKRQYCIRIDPSLQPSEGESPEPADTTSQQ